MAQFAAMIAGAHHRQIGRDEFGRIGRQRRADKPADAVAPFASAARLLAGKIVEALARMGVDHAERRWLLPEVGKDAGNDDVLEHIGEIAGMKGVAVVDRNDPPICTPPNLASRRPRFDIDDLAALHADGAREQLEPIAHHFAVGGASRGGEIREASGTAVVSTSVPSPSEARSRGWPGM